MMEFLVMPQLTSSLVECFSGSSGSCICYGAPLTCEGIFVPDGGCVDCGEFDTCKCFGNRSCECNGHIPVCITDGCWAKTCVMNYSINGT